MVSVWSHLRGRVSNRLARHFHRVPLRLSTGPMVSFTFDDVPDSAARVAAPLIEEYGGRGTFYIAGELVGKQSGHWVGLSRDDIITLHRAGHEIACHTFSHRRAPDLSEAAMAAEIANNRNYFRTLDPSIRLENFAYPYGVASVMRKTQLAGSFHSSRGILPGVNRGVIDLHFLRAYPLIDRDITRDGVDSAVAEAVASNGWLIFYGHDVADVPSPYGCSPSLFRHALEAVVARNIPIITVTEALRRAGV